MAYTRPLKDIRVGGEIDATCTRCRMVTNHRIVAMPDDVIKRVICLTCDSQHNYRQPPGAKKPATASVRRVSKELKKTSDPSGGRIFAQWLASKNKLAASEEETPRSYNFSEAYKAGECLSHPKFGLGFVQKIILPNKLEVMFETEIKTLAMNTNP